MKSTARIAAGLLSLAALASVAGDAQAQAKSIAAVAKFSSMTVNGGKVKQGTPARGVFTVNNVGSAPLIIESVQPASGGCSVNYTKSPIEPGRDGSISLTCAALPTAPFRKVAHVKFAGVTEQTAITLTGQVTP